ncbi:MAG: hypothetical protein IKL05_02160 [Clostridia bacterium]|nr:hypothetical protein [Clostridia bacterium]
MKKLFILLLVACALVLVSCGENEASQAEINNAEEKQLIPSDISENMAQQLLNGEIKVDNYGDKNNLTVAEIGYFGTPLKYTLVDLDEDGARELVVVFAPSEDRIIIDVSEGTSTAYYLPIRWYSDIKKDGTAGWSASAFEHGIRKIKLSNGEVELEDIIVYNTNDGIFRVNGKDVTKEECNIALSRQDEKEAVEWIDIE